MTQTEMTQLIEVFRGLWPQWIGDQAKTNSERVNAIWRMLNQFTIGDAIRETRRHYDTSTLSYPVVAKIRSQLQAAHADIQVIEEPRWTWRDEEQLNWLRRRAYLDYMRTGTGLDAMSEESILARYASRFSMTNPSAEERMSAQDELAKRFAKLCSERHVSPDQERERQAAWWRRLGEIASNNHVPDHIIEHYAELASAIRRSRGGTDA